jgi:glycosyltransferase involved in cell wall biosynthesis
VTRTLPQIAVLIPCYNEEKTIVSVIHDFRRQLPDADIYVYDNNSSDETVTLAKQAGAIVNSEKNQGKGHVIRSMFRQIDADIYVMVDGDGTYPADQVHNLITPIIEGDADIVCGSRLHPQAKSDFKWLNWIGNKIFLHLLNFTFKVHITDILSGYRALNRNIVKSLPILSRGFEIETELTLKAIERRYRLVEIPVNLSARAEGSTSKIKIMRDGFLILSTIFALFRDYKPLTTFGSIGLVFIFLGFIPGIIVIHEFFNTGYILHIPSAILAVGLVLSGILVSFSGLIMHTLSRRFQELDCQMQNLSELHLKQKNNFK